LTDNPQVANDDSITLTYRSYRSGNSSDCNSNGVDLRNISAKDLLVDPIYQPNSNDEQMQIKPEEKEFFDILLTLYNTNPTEQSIFKHAGIKLLISRVGTCQRNTDKIVELLDVYRELVNKF
jgi:hypothetical protein